MSKSDNLAADILVMIQRDIERMNRLLDVITEDRDYWQKSAETWMNMYTRLYLSQLHDEAIAYLDNRTQP